MNVFLQKRFAQCYQVYFVNVCPFETAIMPGISKIDGTGLGFESLLIDHIPAMAALYKNKNKKIESRNWRVERQFPGQIPEIENRKIGLWIHQVERKTKMFVLIVERIE